MIGKIAKTRLKTSVMKPLSLAPYHRSIRTLDGIGPKTAKAISDLCGGERMLNLLLHRPVDGIDRSYSPTTRDAVDGRVATLQVSVIKHVFSGRRGVPHKIITEDDTGPLTLIYFKGARDWLEKTYPIGAKLTVSGMIESWQGQKQMVHPDFAAPEGETITIPPFQPVYPLTKGVTQKTLSKAISAALATLSPLPEWIDTHLLAQEKWPDMSTAITNLHAPKEAQDIDLQNPSRRRLAYDEILSSQSAMILTRTHHKKDKGFTFTGDPELRKNALALLPYTLTTAQQKCLMEVDQDMQSGDRMLRLIQGDVGSGKTILAFLAALNCVSCNKQASIMAPTAILATQHHQSLAPLCRDLGIEITLLTGADKGKIRKKKLEAISTGKAQLIIGTHALFQDKIVFDNLGFVVIDEQHRFGVHQRLALSDKGKDTDILVMTATPIPRTLTLAAYGHMDVSRLEGKPPGRKDVDTRLISTDRMAELVDGLKRKLAAGEQAYWVCPLVEETEKSDLAAAEERHALLQQFFGDQCALIHGRMKAEEKDAVMAGFSSGKTRLLVATTVIEVGVNVPNATVIVIEHAERFGLAQLHQLRGRVGRGDKASSCLLLYNGKLSETAKERLQIMRRSNDGFVIAEKDLELRGAGEVLGTRQSGLPRFLIANMNEDIDLFAIARSQAEMVIQKDPYLKTAAGDSLRHLLYLYGKDEAVMTLRSG